MALLADAVGSLWLSAPRAYAEVVDVLKSLACHLPVSSTGVRDLLLWNCSQHRLPDITEGGNVKAQARERNGERREERRSELSRVQGHPTGRCENRWRRESR
jgi:hypothetical protein